MPEKAEVEIAAVERFLGPVFGEGFTPGPVQAEESQIIGTVLKAVAEQFSTSKYVLGLALDFAVVAQELSKHDPEAKAFRPGLDEVGLFARYPLAARTGKRQVNTLTLTFKAPQPGGKKPSTHKAGIRKAEEAVCDLYLLADRTGYPSAYVYNTGMWHHFKGMLVDCFRLSESGRLQLCHRLIDYGLDKLPKNTFFGREVPRVRLFEEIIRGYDRTAQAGENAGMVFQGIAYAYMNADRPHLSLIVDKSRTGSQKQRRFGDVDCYFGLDLEVSVEVKDEAITAAKVESELGLFARDVQRHRVQGIAFVRSVEEEARNWLLGHGVATIDLAAALASLTVWDWRKQDVAVHGLLHFLAHVEQKPEAVRRLLAFIRENDPTHDSLAYFKPAGSP